MAPFNLFAFNSIHNWRRVLRANPPVAPKYRGKLARLMLPGLLSAPFRVYEQRRHGETLEQVTIHDEPLFIMGPARSGTTHLHNLIGQDPNFGYVSTLQGVAPGFVLSGEKWLRRMVSRALPETRPMDNMAVSLDAPQEEEVAMANTSPHTFLHHLLFPQRARDYFNAYYVMRDITPQALAEWREDYLRVLKVATYLFKGKPLVLKSPINNGRALHLLLLFPRARFINIYREPLHIMVSTRHMYRQILPPHNLQDFTWEDVDRNNLEFMVESMQKWMADRRRIPAKNIVDVRYEDLVENPIGELQRIYEALRLPVKDALPRWKSYLDGLQGYRPNKFEPHPEDTALARQHLGFLYEAWDYPLPEGTET